MAEARQATTLSFVQDRKHGEAKHYRGKDWLESQISQGKGEEAHFEFLVPRSNGNGFDAIKNVHVPISD